MVVMSSIYGAIKIPAWVVDLESFTDWVHSGELPEKLKVHYIDGEVWIDDMEELFSHNAVKMALTLTLGTICRAENLGRLFVDGAFYRNAAGNVATEPDAIFVSAASLAAGRVTFTAGQTTPGVATILEGSPDVVVEVVSRSSVDKDWNRLMVGYFAAGVSEYWVIDARTDEPDLTIHRRGAKAFTAVRKAKGWSKSDAFSRAFRLVPREQFGLLDFVLETK